MTALLTVTVFSVIVLLIGVTIVIENKDRKFGLDIIKGILLFDCFYITLVLIIGLAPV